MDFFFCKVITNIEELGFVSKYFEMKIMFQKIFHDSQKNYPILFGDFLVSPIF